MTGVTEAHERAAYLPVLRVREFAALTMADVLSTAGDQLARVALSVLVFQRTGSPLLTAVAYAMTFLPWIVAGPLTSGLADRLPRRDVLILCDAVRALLILAVALPGMPIPAILALVFVAELFAPAFEASRATTLPTIFPVERDYVAASALTGTASQAAQLVGFAVGGVLVALLSARGTLLVDAVSFAVSAVLIRCRVKARPAAATRLGRSWRRDLGTGAQTILADRRLKVLAGLALLCGVYIVPEALAAPYAASRGDGPVAVGLLLAAMPAGFVVGALVVGRLHQQTRARLLVPMAAAVGVPLVLGVLSPSLVWTLVAWVVAGAFTAYNVIASTAFMLAVSEELRGQAYGLVRGGMQVMQGLGLLAAGALADVWSPLTVVAAAGTLVVLLATALGLQVGGSRAEIPTNTS